MSMGNHSLVIGTDVVIDLQSLLGGLYDKPPACDRVIAHVSVAPLSAKKPTPPLVGQQQVICGAHRTRMNRNGQHMPQSKAWEGNGDRFHFKVLRRERRRYTGFRPATHTACAKGARKALANVAANVAVHPI